MLKIKKYLSKENIASLMYALMTPLSVADGVLIALENWNLALSLLCILTFMEFFSCKIYIKAVKEKEGNSNE